MRKKVWWKELVETERNANERMIATVERLKELAIVVKGKGSLEYVHHRTESGGGRSAMRRRKKMG